MNMNDDKSHFNVFGGKEDVAINIGSSIDNESQNEKFLGATLDENLSFKEHIFQYLQQKPSQKLQTLPERCNRESVFEQDFYLMFIGYFWPSVRSHYDRCGRFCKVLNGQLVNCCRVRKDFESMTAQEQRRYIRAFKIISTRQPYKRTYDSLIKMHESYFRTRIHQKAEFLPWHRWFNLQIENLLQKVDCRVTLAYWDWSIWSHDPWNKKKIWSSRTGLGGNGRSSDECVTTGPFRVGVWKTVSGKCLKRAFNGNPPDADQVQITLKEPTFQKFELMLRVNIHEAMHCFINGTMCSGKAAEAPEFFLHHGFIDKIWADYQHQSRVKKFAYFSSINRRMVGVSYGPKRMLDNNNLPGGVRVCYKNPTIHMARKIRAYLKRLSLRELESLERIAFSRTPTSAKKIFHLSARERRLAKYLEDKARRGVLDKRHSLVLARALSPLERVEGFEVPTVSRRRAYGDTDDEE